MKYIIFKIKEKCLNYNGILKLNKIFNNIIVKCRFNKRLSELSKLSIFDYEELAHPMVRYYTDFVPENNDKNMSRCLKEYMGVDVNMSIDTMIEHGLFFGDYVADREHILNVPSIITFGDQRIKHLTKKGIEKKIIPIGPYIHYASPILSHEEHLALKKKLGRVLLVFPCHSLNSEGLKSLYDIKEFSDEIDRIAQNFDTVLISLHYNDILLAKDYEAKGYKCVTSGHTNDPFFMHRHRSIIELSDITMSNAVGTHVGYCIYLKKPHYIFKQNINKKHDSVFRALQSQWVDKCIRDKEIHEVEEAFNFYSTEISEKQYKVVNYYWGVKYIKSPTELKSMLTFSKF